MKDLWKDDKCTICPPPSHHSPLKIAREVARTFYNDAQKVSPMAHGKKVIHMNEKVCAIRFPNKLSNSLRSADRSKALFVCLFVCSSCMNFNLLLDKVVWFAQLLFASL